MATTVKQLCALLDECELTYYRHPRNDSLVVTCGEVTVRLSLQRRGEVLRAQVRHLAKAPNPLVGARCRRHIAEVNDRLHFVRARCSARTGEVRFWETLRLADSQLTARQLSGMVRGLSKVVTRELPALRQLVEPARTADADRRWAEMRHGTPENLRLHQRATESMLCALGGGRAVPEGPLTEEEWLRAAVESMAPLTRHAHRSDDVTRAREEIWPRLQDLRARSMEAGHDYRLLALAAEVEIGPAEEFVLLYMLGRQQQRQRAIPTEDFLWVYAADLDEARADELVQRLHTAELIVAADGDDMEPWRLGRRFLDPLAGRLPFAYEPLPPPYDPAELPAGPLAESEWLALVHEVLRHQAADFAEAERLALLGERLWPALLALRDDSIAAGHVYQTAEARALFELDDLAELAVVYTAYQNATGRPRIDVFEFRQLARGVRMAASELSLGGLMSAGLLDACDGDEASPWCLGEAGLAWRAA